MKVFGRRFILFVTFCGASMFACSGDDHPKAIDFNVQLTSVHRVLHEVGPAKQVIYGWNQLSGTTEIDGQAANVELLGSVDYTKGSGDFFGFVTVSFSGESSLALRMTEGRTEAATDTTNATFTSPIRVIGGTGDYLNATGSGTFEGERNEALGGLVEAIFHVNVSLE